MKTFLAAWNPQSFVHAFLISFVIGVNVTKRSCASQLLLARNCLKVTPGSGKQPATTSTSKPKALTQKICTMVMKHCSLWRQHPRRSMLMLAQKMSHAGQVAKRRTTSQAFLFRTIMVTSFRLTQFFAVSQFQIDLASILRRTIPTFVNGSRTLLMRKPIVVNLNCGITCNSG